MRAQEGLLGSTDFPGHSPKLLQISSPRRHLTESLRLEKAIKSCPGCSGSVSLTPVSPNQEWLRSHPKAAPATAFSLLCSEKAPAEKTQRICPCLCHVLGSQRTKSTGGMAGIIVTMVTNLIRAGSSGVDFKWQHGILCESIASLPPLPCSLPASTTRLHPNPPHPAGCIPLIFPHVVPFILFPRYTPEPTHSRGLENATVEQFNNTAARCATVYPTCHSKEPFSGAETCYPAILTNTS